MIALFAAALPGPAPAEAPPQSEAEVQDLVARAREGDQRAARRLFRLYASRVYRAVRPLASCDDDAEEIVQETFVRAFGALHRYRPSPRARFVSWLLTIAQNRARSHGRSARRRQVPVGHEVIERLQAGRGEVEPPRREDEGGEGGRKAALLAVLSEIDERARRILTLRYGAGLTAAEVGRLCGLREANVRKQCQRLRARVLERVEARLRAEEEAAAPGEARPDETAERVTP